MNFTYLGLHGVLEQTAPTAQDVERQLLRLQQSTPRLVEITDRAAANGDDVLLDYAGFADGVQFDGGTAENQTLTLGSGAFIPGFEQQLIGALPGSDVTVNVTFPAQYHAPELAGKDAQFRCHVHKIFTRETYELDDTFAKEVGQCDTLDELRKKLTDLLQAQMDEQAEQELCGALMSQAAMTLDYQPSKEELRSAVDEHIAYLSAQLSQKGLTLEQYCQFTGKSPEQLRSEAQPDAEKTLRQEKAAALIAQLEHFTVSDEDLNTAYTQVCRLNGLTMEQLQPYLTEAFVQDLTQSILQSKAVALVLKSAIVTTRNA